MSKKKLYTPTIVTGVVTLDHCALLEPKLGFNAKEGDKKQFTANAFCDAKDPNKPLAKLEEAVAALIKEWGIPAANLDTTGIRTGEDKIAKAEKPENAEYLRGKLFIAPKKSDEKGGPKLFKYDRETKAQILLKTPQEIDEHFYRGAKVVLSITASNYEFAGKKGITLYLNNVMFVAHGTRIGGATGAEFSGTEINYDFDSADDAV
jgi:hypothetical protein